MILRSIFTRRKVARGYRRVSRGQSMVEMALTFPVLLLILAGAVEVGVYYNTYLTLMDATREGARRSANNDYLNGDLTYDCTETVDFYRQGACLVYQNLERNLPDVFNPARDDILISVIQIRHGVIYKRFVDPYLTESESGWSFCADMGPHLVPPVSCTRAYSRFPNSVLQARLTQYSDAASAPNSAYVLVEIYHVHHQFLGLIPPGLPFLPQEVVMHTYSIMPVPSAASDVP
ncbi:MAG: TadE family protein [Anaerolineae bacterium]